MDQLFERLKGERPGTRPWIQWPRRGRALEHPWPGNVRELKNRVERALALARGEWIMPGDLFPEWQQRPTQPTAGHATLANVREPPSAARSSGCWS